MPYDISTKDGIILKNIPDDIDPNSDILKERVAQIRSTRNGSTQQESLSAEEETKGPGIFSRIKDVVTGESKMTPEMQALPGIGQLPELNKMSLDSLKSAFVTMTGDPKEAAMALKANFPGIEIRQDEKGNFIVRSSVDQKDYKVNEPGLDSRDLIRGALTAAMFTPAGGVGGLGLKMVASAATQGAIEYAQSGAGGEFNSLQIPLAAATELIPAGIGKGIQVGKSLYNGAKGIVSDLAQGVKSAESFGITPMTSDVLPPTTHAGKLWQSIGERVPYTGTGGRRSSQQADRADAVRLVATAFGADEVAQASDDVMEDLLKRRGEKIQKFVNLKNNVFEKIDNVGIDNKRRGPIESSIKKINKKIDELKSSRLSNINEYEKEGLNAPFQEYPLDLLNHEDSLKIPVKASIEEIDNKIGSLKKLGLPELDPLLNMMNKYKKSLKIPVKDSMEEIDSQVNNFEKLRLNELKPLINLMNDYKESLNNKYSIKDIDILRSQVGKELASPKFSGIKDIGEKAFSKIYGAVNNDLGEFIKKNGGSQDFSKWKSANKNLEEMISELRVGSFKSALDKGDITPEMVNNVLFSSKPSDVKLLHKSLSESGRNKAKIAIMQKVVNDAGGLDNISTQKFMTQLNKKGLPVSTFYSAADKQVLDGLMKALELTKRAGDANVKPPTGAELTTFVAPSAFSWLLGGNPAAGLAATGALGAAARIYESKPIRNLLIMLSNAKPGKEANILKKLGPLLQAEKDKLNQEEE